MPPASDEVGSTTSSAEAPPKPIESSPRPKRAAVPPVKRPATPASWDNLASALGVETPLVEEPRRPVPPPSARPVVPPTPEPERKVVFNETLSPPFEPLETPDEILSEIEAERDVTEIEEPAAERTGPSDESEERPRRRRRRRGRGGRDRREGDGRTESDEPAPEAAREPVEDALEEEPAAARESTREPQADEGDGSRGGKRRRRRRRGRGDRDRESVPAEASTSSSSASARSQETAGEPADDHDVPEAEDDDPDAVAGDKSLHRAIPSWQEAIGMIIAVNMESRAKHPERNGAHGRGGRDRGGRDRGGRDRGRRDRGGRDSGRGAR